MVSYLHSHMFALHYKNRMFKVFSKKEEVRVGEEGATQASGTACAKVLQSAAWVRSENGIQVARAIRQEELGNEAGAIGGGLVSHRGEQC